MLPVAFAFAAIPLVVPKLAARPLQGNYGQSAMDSKLPTRHSLALGAALPSLQKAFRDFPA